MARKIIDSYYILLSTIESLQNKITDLENQIGGNVSPPQPDDTEDENIVATEIRILLNDDDFYDLRANDEFEKVYKMWNEPHPDYNIPVSLSLVDTDGIKPLSVTSSNEDCIDVFIQPGSEYGYPEGRDMLIIRGKKDGKATITVTDGDVSDSVDIIYVVPNEEVMHNVTYELEGVSLANTLNDVTLENNQFIEQIAHGQSFIISNYGHIEASGKINLGSGGYLLGTLIDINYTDYIITECKIFIDNIDLSARFAKTSSYNNNINIYADEVFGDVHIVLKVKEIILPELENE